MRIVNDATRAPLTMITDSKCEANKGWWCSKTWSTDEIACDMNHACLRYQDAVVILQGGPIWDSPTLSHWKPK